jgi:hypothetical protein
MDFPLSYPGFEGQNLVVRSVGLFGFRPSLLKAGMPLRRKNGCYVLTSNGGREVKVRLKRRVLDPLPKVTIGETQVDLARPLRTRELLWICFPLILACAGGALGGAVGGLAAYVSGHVFRSGRDPGEKYALTALVTLCALSGYVVLAWAIHSLVLGGGPPHFASLLREA